MLLNRCFLFYYFIYITNLFSIISVSNGSKILVINHFAISSHAIIFNSVLEQLIPRGHNVTYLGAFPYTGHLKSNVTQYLLKSDVITKGQKKVMKIMRDSIDPSQSSSPIESVLRYARFLGEEPCTYLENDFVTGIMNSTTTYDVIILNACASECFYSIAYMKKIPLILLTTSLVFPFLYNHLGIDPYFGIEKSFMLNYPQDNLIQRTLDIIAGNLFILQWHQIFASAIDSWLLKNYPNARFPSFYELKNNFSLLLVNSIPEMGYARSESPTVVNFGGIHIHPPQKLPHELERFISATDNEGIIYFSLGGTFLTNVVPKYLINIFLEAFKQLPYRVLMKWNDNSTILPINVLSSPWLPQQDILGDSRIRVFITQGGILSLQEAVYHGVPVIAFPLCFDQFVNAEQAVKLGYGIKLDIKTITTPLLINTIQKLIEPSFKNAAQKLSVAVRDTLNTPQEKVTWWIEYVIRNGGTERLRTARQRLSWFQQQQFDILILLIAVGVAAVLLFYLSISATCSLIATSFKMKEKQS